ASRIPRDLPSFPTRRSSDLASGIPGGPFRFWNQQQRPSAVDGSPTMPALSRWAWRSAGRCRFLGYSPSLVFLTSVVSLDRRRSRSEEHTSELQSPYDLVCRL